MTKIAFITDLHIPQEGIHPLGLNPLKQFKDTLNHAILNHPDLIIIGGDLSHRDPILFANNITRRLLERTGISFLIMAGNHDDPSDLAETFNIPLVQGSLCYLHRLREEEIMILDSSSKRISHSQLSWMKSNLVQNIEINKIFIHHPLSVSGIPYMDDNHALLNREEVVEHLSELNRKFYVFSGHCHANKTIHSEQLTQFITPSTYLQISAHAHDFKIDHTQPGYRWIEVQEKVGFSTSVYYPDLQNKALTAAE